MIKNRNIVFILVNIILGLSVMLSYIWGIIYNDDPSLLWGRVNVNHIPYNHDLYHGLSFSSSIFFA